MGNLVKFWNFEVNYIRAWKHQKSSLHLLVCARLSPACSGLLRLTPTSECKMRIAFVDLARAQEVHRHCKKGDLQQRTQIYHSVPRSACDPSLPLRRTSSAPSPWSSPPPLPPHPAVGPVRAGSSSWPAPAEAGGDL